MHLKKKKKKMDRARHKYFGGSPLVRSREVVRHLPPGRPQRGMGIAVT